MRELTLDTETTGLDPAKGHRLVEVGIVELYNRVRTGNVFHFYVNPEREVPKEAIAIHGITTEFLQDKPKFSEIARDLVEFIGNDALVIHNAPFDLKFLNFELQLLDLAPITLNPIVDTLDIARKKYPGAPANLDALCRRFKIDLSRREKHGALLDADLLADVYVQLAGGNQAAMILEVEEVSYEAVKITQFSRRQKRKARKFEASQAEKEAHHMFLKKIKNPLWAG